MLAPLVEAGRRGTDPGDPRGAEVDLVWPLSGGERPVGPLSDTFGPRIKVSEERYDFHRGIDLPAEQGTEIHAVADGEVRLAGTDAAYDNPVLQLEHRSPNGEVYYSNYLHIADWSVEPGDTVQQGDVIGRVGVSASGFPHLHFELREGDVYRHNCVHPLSYLPYDDTGGGEIERLTVTRSEGDGRTSFRVRVPDDELDIRRYGVAVRSPDGSIEVSEFDAVRTNRRYEDSSTLDDPAFRDDLRLDPRAFHTDQAWYRLGVEFRELELGPEATVMVFAEDVGGRQVREFACPSD
jgi:murein DD-endopeptidase MepM/ murein hydrolase activator NlpD